MTALRFALTTADVASSIILFIALSAIILGADWRTKWEISTGSDAVIPALAYALGWVSASWLVGLYRLRASWTLGGQVREVLRLGAIVASSTIIVIFALNLDEVSRPLMVSLFIGQMAITFISRMVIRAVFGWLRVRGYNTRQLLVLGTGETAASFARLIGRHDEIGLD
ncbi:MAG: nucleoside-diphosphate sugar epimerase/dehydratase, partial [Candidatus Limnocylindrales bacterium]